LHASPPPRKRRQENLGGGIELFDVDVIERRVKQEAVTAANGRLAMAGDESAPLWLVSEAHARAKAVLGRREGGESTHFDRYGLAGKIRACRLILGPQGRW